MTLKDFAICVVTGVILGGIIAACLSGFVSVGTYILIHGHEKLAISFVLGCLAPFLLKSVVKKAVKAVK